MTLTINVPQALEEKLELIAAERGIALDKLVLETLEKLNLTSEAQASEPAGDYLLRLAEEARASVPDEAWGVSQNDHARNFKHYLYGAPKEQ